MDPKSLSTVIIPFSIAKSTDIHLWDFRLQRFHVDVNKEIRKKSRVKLKFNDITVTFQ